MNSFSLLIIISSIINNLHCEIACPAGSETETIFLDSINDMNGGFPSQEAIPSDECFAVQEDNGWSFESDAGLCRKINWYFQAAVNDKDSRFNSWNTCNTPDIISTAPGEGVNGCILLGCLREIEFTIQGEVSDNSGIFIRIYTKTKGQSPGNEVNGYLDRTFWHRSRMLIPGNAWKENGTPTTTVGASFPTPTTLTVTLPADYSDIGAGTDSFAPNLTTIVNTEEIRAIAFSTDSAAGAGENNFTVSQFITRYNDGCTCPTERIFDLRRVDSTTMGDEIGSDCPSDIGTCDDCTCKQMCVHQNKISNGMRTVTNVGSQEECCDVCNCISDCLAYTYIRSIQGISTTCQSLNEGDCVLYDNKLSTCDEDESLQYDAVSGSKVDGMCDSDGDCCQPEECDSGGMCVTETPTEAPFHSTPAPQSGSESGGGGYESGEDSRESAQTVRSRRQARRRARRNNNNAQSEGNQQFIRDVVAQSENRMSVNLEWNEWYVLVIVIVGILIMINLYCVCNYWCRRCFNKGDKYLRVSMESGSERESDIEM